MGEAKRKREDGTLFHVTRREIPSVWQTPEEFRLMQENYRPDRINLFVFLGEEHPYTPMISRLGLPAICSIRQIVKTATGHEEITDDNEPRMVELLVDMLHRTLKKEYVEPGTLPVLVWPMVEHNIPEMKTITSVPERNCVFVRLTLDPHDGLRDSIYSCFSGKNLLRGLVL